MKSCKKCLDIKPVDLFYKNISRKDKLSDWCKACNNKDGKSYRKNNPQKVYEWSKTQRLKNPKAAILATKNWVENNRGVKNALNAARHAAKMGQTPKWLSKEHKNQIKDIYATAQLISQVIGEKIEVDHIIPLRGVVVRGLHVPWNLQLIEAKENRSKGNRRYPNGFAKFT